MQLEPILEWMAYGIYTAMGLVALFGSFTIILLTRNVGKKRFHNSKQAEEFLDDIRGSVEKQNYEEAADMCDQAPFWAMAVPQLILVGLANRARPIVKLRKILGEHFEREVIAELEYGMSWVNTVVKTAPMLGLLGTVTGMIAAFGKISTAAGSGGLKPEQLAGDISFALFTTAMGLMIAVPLVVAGAFVQVRIGKMQDQVSQYLTVFLEDLETANTKTGRR
jgi:biopolymer transport protein ExbB/TolQ